MRTPAERAHDQWAAAYLVAVLRRDQTAMRTLLTQVQPRELWDLLDALGDAARDTIEAFTTGDQAAEVLSARLVEAALDTG